MLLKYSLFQSIFCTTHRNSTSLSIQNLNNISENNFLYTIIQFKIGSWSIPFFPYTFCAIHWLGRRKVLQLLCFLSRDKIKRKICFQYCRRRYINLNKKHWNIILRAIIATMDASGEEPLSLPVFWNLTKFSLSLMNLKKENTV